MDKNLQIKLMLVTLISKYKEFEMAGGSLHILLDDGNYGHTDLNDCIEYDDYFGEIIAMLLNQLTEDEQEQVVERSYEIEQEAGDIGGILKT